MLSFEIIAETPTGIIKRAPVFGGWVVINEVTQKGSVTSNMVFIADADHQWSVE